MNETLKWILSFILAIIVVTVLFDTLYIFTNNFLICIQMIAVAMIGAIIFGIAYIIKIDVLG